MAAFAWVRHVLRGPATGRDELLITADIAQSRALAELVTDTATRARA